MESTNIQVFYLRQQNKDTKNFLVFFTDFIILCYGEDLISNNLNDNILKKIYAFFFLDFFFLQIFFFQPDLFLYFTFPFLFFLFFFAFFCNFGMDS